MSPVLKSVLIFLIAIHSSSESFKIVSTTERIEPVPPSTKQLQQYQEIIKILNEHSKKLEILESGIKKKNNTSYMEKYLNNGIIPKNCKEIQERGFTQNGIYVIQPTFSLKPFKVLCDMKTHDGGWTYVLNRFDGSQKFYLPWESYKNGFGNLTAEFWLGLEKLHLLTGYEVNQLLIEMVSFTGEEAYAKYNTFIIGNEREGYSLKVLVGHSGTAGDSLSYNAGMKFTTKDRDQDTWEGVNCAERSQGAWWYAGCKKAQLTGQWGEHYDDDTRWQKIYWRQFTGVHTLKEVRMMIKPHRPVSSNPAL